MRTRCLGQCSGMARQPPPSKMPGVAVSFMFAGLAVADYAAAYNWYVRLLGREADMFPHDTECVWRLTPTSSIYVVEDRKLAGNGLVTLALDDFDAQERRMREGDLRLLRRPAEVLLGGWWLETPTATCSRSSKIPTAQAPEPSLGRASLTLERRVTSRGSRAALRAAARRRQGRSSRRPGRSTRAPGSPRPGSASWPRRSPSREARARRT